jgi:SpoVK/Ycf46/Vps4 family AAA+-type ATPase
MGLRSLRVRVEDVGSLGSEPVVEMMRIFDPDVVIFDDLDRAMSQVALLETLENLHKRVRFVFATVNHIESLQQALIRPGRFDELIEITKLDPAAIHKVLGPECMDSYEAVKNWPVAFINEFVLRRKVLGKEKALEALDELAKRVDRLMGNMQPGEPTDGDDNDDGPSHVEASW